MHRTLLQILLILFLGIELSAQVASQDSSTAEADTLEEALHPLDIYLNEMDEMGRTLSSWSKDSLGHGSWFFGSYAMLLLNNNGRGENVPLPGFEAVVPALWSDFKYITPRYLVELAGGALSHGNLMSIQEDQVFEKMQTEERFILVVAGFSYLRMLQGTIGDSLFSVVVKDAMQHSKDPFAITHELTTAMSRHCCQTLARQFEIALNSSRWCDASLEGISRGKDSTEIEIKFESEWRFPVEVLVIDKGGDSTRYTYGIHQTRPLRVPNIRIEKVILDPGHVLAEYYRYNNQLPRLKDRVYMQPFGALPDWTNYRMTINPSIWRDWDKERRYGLKLTSGFGVDLWPAYPSDYRHRISLEWSAHSPYDEALTWGGRISYGHALDLEKRLFSHLNLHTYDDWSGVSAGLTRYVGKQTFLIQGPRLTYQRVGLALEYDRYGDSRIWSRDQEIHIVKGSYSALSLTRTGNRVYGRARVAHGEGPQGRFSIVKSQIDLSGVSWGWFVGGLQVVSGFQSNSTPTPYQFTHTYAWQDGLAAIPSFRGQTKLLNNTSEYVGWSISAGYWVSGIQVKLFTSSMIVDMDELGWDGVRPHYAAGFGFEHNSFFTVGLYFPLWQSHPLEGEDAWAWRYQTRFTWNL